MNDDSILMVSGSPETLSKKLAKFVQHSVTGSERQVLCSTGLKPASVCVKTAFLPTASPRTGLRNESSGEMVLLLCLIRLVRTAEVLQQSQQRSRLFHRLLACYLILKNSSTRREADSERAR